LSERGIHIDPEMPEEIGNPWMLGLVAQPDPEHEGFAGRLAIPYTTPRGPGPVGMKFRCLRHTDCKAVDCPKYLAHTGMGQRLYNVGAFQVESDTIGITEGEFDAIVASEAGIPSVAVPGVKGWHDAWQFCFEGYSRVLVFGDGDDAGRPFAEKICALVQNAQVVHFPDGHDVTSFVIEHGADALRERTA
jgi:DNA primase